MDNICTCLGQDITDLFGCIQEMRRSIYISKLIEEEKRSDWVFVREVSLHTKISAYRRVPVSYRSHHSVRDVSFGFQTIAEIAKCILAQNTTKITKATASAKIHRHDCGDLNRTQLT